MNAALEVDVEAVSKDRVTNIRKVAKELALHQGLVRSDEVSLQTAELRLDHPLNTSVLNNIEVLLRSVLRTASGSSHRINGSAPTVHGGEQGVSHFVTHKHIVERTAGVAPQREVQTARLQIEKRGGDVLVLHRNILGGKQTRKRRLHRASGGRHGRDRRTIRGRNHAPIVLENRGFCKREPQTKYSERKPLVLKDLRGQRVR